VKKPRRAGADHKSAEDGAQLSGESRTLPEDGQPDPADFGADRLKEVCEMTRPRGNHAGQQAIAAPCHVIAPPWLGDRELREVLVNIYNAVDQFPKMESSCGAHETSDASLLRITDNRDGMHLK